MNIEFIAPLMRAWNRMKSALFQPFNINTWLTVGFNAFLAGILDGSGGNSGGGNGNKGGGSNFQDVVQAPIVAWEWLKANPLWSALIAMGVLFLVALLILFAWLSSRAKFAFLDNVVQGRAEITKPWREQGNLGDSYFLWRLGFGFIGALFLGLILAYFFRGAAFLYESGFSGNFPWLFVIKTALIAVALLVALKYIDMLANDFVAPIMYKNRINVLEAWKRFLPLFSGNILNFVLYGLLVLVLTALVVACVIAAGFLTCCVGFLLLALPYVGAVVLLPVSYTYRAFSVEFLGQFGREYKLFRAARKAASKKAT